MNPHKREQLPWLAELCALVRDELAARNSSYAHSRPALERELAICNEKIAGWSESLAKRDLDVNVRALIEKESSEAIARAGEIEHALEEADARENCAEQVIDEDEVIRRLTRLGDVVAGNCPTLGNLELSLHIDRIVCHKDGSIVMRTCKLGSFTGALDLLIDHDPVSDEHSDPDTTDGEYRPRSRRRGRVRVDPEDDAGFDMVAAANFAADPDRFAGLPDDWFWVDRFTIPDKEPGWSSANAEIVHRRYQEIERETGKTPSLSALAREFGKSRPSISRALAISLNGRPEKPARNRGQGDVKVKDVPDIEDEIVRRHLAGEESKEIANRFGVHRNTVARALDLIAESPQHRESGR